MQDLASARTAVAGYGGAGGSVGMTDCLTGTVVDSLMTQHNSAQVGFEAVLSSVGGTTLLRLPESASRSLPSRGQVAVHGTINGIPFTTVLEPDGVFGHWMKVSPRLQRAARVRKGQTAALDIVVTEEWPEPEVPDDLMTALTAAPDDVRAVWRDITPMARWEWVRWVNATRNVDTRTRRVAASISKIDGGKRRPCCFNLAGCTDPDVSRSGKLRETEEA